MKKHFSVNVGLVAYGIAWLIILHWIFICSFDEFIHLYKRGFNEQTINLLPLYLKPLYTGVPNLITLITFMLFTFAACFLADQRKKLHYCISISSFLMIAYLFLFLVKL